MLGQHNYSIVFRPDLYDFMLIVRDHTTCVAISVAAVTPIRCSSSEPSESTIANGVLTPSRDFALLCLASCLLVHLVDYCVHLS